VTAITTRDQALCLDRAAVESLATADIVAAYNLLAEKPVKKFETREKAIERLNAIIAKHNLSDMLDDEPETNEQVSPGVELVSTGHAPFLDASANGLNEPFSVVTAEGEHSAHSTEDVALAVAADLAAQTDTAVTVTDGETATVVPPGPTPEAPARPARAAVRLLKLDAHYLDALGKALPDEGGWVEKSMVKHALNGRETTIISALINKGFLERDETRMPAVWLRITPAGRDAMAALNGDKPAEMRRGKKSRYHDKRIKIIAQGNPRKPGSHGHRNFGLYRNGMTYAEYAAEGGINGQFLWDLRHGFIELTD
jgi:hypothetical protein